MRKRSASCVASPLSWACTVTKLAPTSNATVCSLVLVSAANSSRASMSCVCNKTRCPAPTVARPPTNRNSASRNRSPSISTTTSTSSSVVCITLRAATACPCCTPKQRTTSDTIDQQGILR
uniref:Putative secreted protein n=1 Tax=Anopheles darlingi TaxID=43151 RepID=A0A2M4D3N4_ANODA